jgi:hypothetical protein
MLLASIIVCVAATALALLLFLTRQRARTARWLKDPSRHLRSVDLAAFRNLIDPAEDRYLREHLPAGEFRAIKQKRLRAAVQYVKAVGENAGVLLRLGQAARLNANTEIAAEAEGLVNAALQLRLTAVRALIVLYIRILLPGRDVRLDNVADRYQKITGKFASLSLRYQLRDAKSAL